MSLEELKSYKIIIVIIFIIVPAILILSFYDYNIPKLQNPETLNIFLTLALVIFASIEAGSTISKYFIERKRKRTIDLRNELRKFYGPVHSVLNNVVYTEESKAILTEDEKKILDETFSKKPFTLLTSQEEWRNHFHVNRLRDIDAWFINRFIEEYERNKEKESVERQFSSVYSKLKDIPQSVAKVAILLPHEKKIIDKLFLTYPYMVRTELYNYWNTKIRIIKPTFENSMRHLLIFQENLKNPKKESEVGFYLIPEAFTLEFFEEYNKKVYEYRKV
jgi:hypothetical protein